MRTVELRNSSPSPIRLIDSTGAEAARIAAFGTCVLDYPAYVDAASSNDLLDLGISAYIRNETVREVNVKDFGAVGDGIGDDTIAFQTAIDSSESAGGGVVGVGSGVYRVSSIRVGTNVKLSGESHDNTILKATSGIILMDDDSSIDRISIIGSGMDSSKCVLVGGSGVSIDDCMLSNASSCIMMGNGSSLVLRNSVLSPMPGSGSNERMFYSSESPYNWTITESFCTYE